jgi:hypothetical protein
MSGAIDDSSASERHNETRALSLMLPPEVNSGTDGKPIVQVEQNCKPSCMLIFNLPRTLSDPPDMRAMVAANDWEIWRGASGSGRRRSDLISNPSRKRKWLRKNGKRLATRGEPSQHRTAQFGQLYLVPCST